MKPQHTVRVYMFFDEPTDPVAVSDRLEIAATRTWRKGEQKTNTRRTHEFDGLCFESTLPREESAERHLLHLFSRVPLVKVNALRLLAPSLDVQFSIVVHIFDQTPELNFSQTTLSALSQYDASLDIDTYVQPEA